MGHARLWRWWTENWSAPGGPGRARWLYVVMAGGFGSLALLAGLTGDAAVAALAGIAAVVTLLLAVLAPQLTKWIGGG